MSMGKPVNGLKKKRSKLVSITTWFTNGFTWKYIPVEDVDLHPDGDLEGDALLWHEGEVGGVLLLVGLEVGLGVELVEEGGVLGLKFLFPYQKPGRGGRGRPGRSGGRRRRQGSRTCTRSR